MKALTIHQPWASLIAHGWKSVEFRSWPAPNRMIGQRIVIHAGKHPAKRGVQELLAADDAGLIASIGPSSPDRLATVRGFLEAAADRGYAMRLSCGLGTAMLGNMLEPSTCAHNWGWPLLQVERWDEPVPARGAQGFWEWT
ncbi:MAG: ASCH domain-containing protein [Geminicoccaceae bacterium]